MRDQRYAVHMFAHLFNIFLWASIKNFLIRTLRFWVWSRMPKSCRHITSYRCCPVASFFTSQIPLSFPILSLSLSHTSYPPLNWVLSFTLLFSLSSFLAISFFPLLYIYFIDYLFAILVHNLKNFLDIGLTSISLP